VAATTIGYVVPDGSRYGADHDGQSDRPPNNRFSYDAIDRLVSAEFRQTSELNEPALMTAY